MLFVAGLVDGVIGKPGIMCLRGVVFCVRELLVM